MCSALLVMEGDHFTVEMEEQALGSLPSELLESD